MPLPRTLARATLAAFVSIVGLQATAFGAQAGASTIKLHVDPHPGVPTPCVASPHSCGYPDAATTGVPAGVTLTKSSSITEKTAGAVLSSLDVNGSVQVEANNVTIQNSRITCGAGCTGHFTIEVTPGVTGLVIRDTEVSATQSVNAGIGGGGTFTLLRGNVHGGIDGVHVASGAAVRDSYIHDLNPTLTSHDDTIQQISASADRVSVIHNTLLPYNSTTHVYNNSAYICGSQCVATTNMVFTDNLMNGGSHTLQCSPAGAVNNVFARNRFSNEYRFGPVDASCKTVAGNSFDASNVMDGTNVPV